MSLPHNSSLDFPNMEPSLEYEVAALVFSLMGMGVLGVLLNNIVFIVLKDAPGLRASAINILLANLCLCNLLISTVVFPFSAIYVGYAHANGRQDVGMVFCGIYTLICRATLAILPFTLFAMSWHVFLAGKRAADRVYGVPGTASSAMPQIVPMASAFVASGSIPGSVTSVDTMTHKPTPEQRRRKVKARMMHEGPDTRKQIVLAAIWAAAGLCGMVKFFGTEKKMVAGHQVAAMAQHTPAAFNASAGPVMITRYVDVTYCTIWVEQHDMVDLLSGLVIVGAPLVLGPVLTATLEVTFIMVRVCAGTNRRWQPKLPSRSRQWVLILLLTLVMLIFYSVNLYLAEAVMPRYFPFLFHVLMSKYVLGYLHVLFVPLIVLAVDPDLREGVTYVLNSRKYGITSSSTEVSWT